MPKGYPRTLLEFEHRFRTEDACLAYLERLRWPEGFHCRKCNSPGAWRTARGRLLCRNCRAEASITTGTLFHQTHIPLRIWFRAIWWATNQKSGVSALGLQRTLGLGSYQTAWTCLHKLRRAMIRPGRESLSGRVEVDEFFLGGREKGIHGGRHVEDKSIVMVAAEAKGTKIGRIRLRRIPDTSRRSLFSFIRDFIAPGSEIITDGWMGYAGLGSTGYGHEIRVVRTGGIGTASTLMPRAHRVSSLLKRWLLGIHQGRVTKEHLDYYLDEFTFRFNRRASPHRGMLFYRLLQQAAHTDPVRGKTLIKCV